MGWFRWNDASKWLVLEGFIPLFGAGFLYLVLGIGLFISTKVKSAFRFNWVGFFDPLGWLYGATILSVQAGFKCLPSTERWILTLSCFSAGSSCLLLLVTAMFLRGGDRTYEPPASLKVVTVVLVAVVLIAGYNVNVR